MKYVLIISLFFVQSCSRNNYPKFDYTKSDNPWIDAFKDRVFFSALKEAYKSDTLIFKLIKKKDALNPYDGLSLEEIENANKIGIALIKKMPPPAICENCSENVNYFMATALHYYKSKELHNIVSSSYKVHKRNDKKINLAQN